MRIQEFKKICKIAKKTRCKINIKRKRGIPFLVHRYKKRKIFLFLLITLIITMIISTNFIWNVDIIEENEEKIENLIYDLDEVGLKQGTLKSKINTKEMINKIRLKRKDIAWIGIELKGTNAIVKVVKAEEKPEIIDESEYCSIVANKTGIITKINALTRNCKCKSGRYSKSR